MVKAADLINEREKTHGRFADNARIAQSLRSLFRAEPTWQGMTDVQREALDCIALKLCRILSGQASVRDHWADLGGYAELAARDTPPE